LVTTSVGADLKHNGGAAEGASMASIHERKRRKGVVFMGSYRDPTGDQHTKSFARRRDAESFARRVEVDKEDGRWSDPAAGRVTVAKKSRKGRAVHVGPQLRQMLKEHLTKYGRPLDPGAYVFTGDRNAQIR
jgi:hypothetical protein